MKGRLFASLLLLPVILIPPIRAAFEAFGLLLWPSRLFGSVPATVPIHLLVVLIALYLVACYAVDKAVAHARHESGDHEPLTLRHGGDVLTLPAIIVTVGWLIGALLLKVLSWPLAATAVLVLLGITAGKESAPPPAPRPNPLPEPPAPLKPEPVVPPGEGDEDGAESYTREYSWLFQEEPYRKTGREQRFKVRLAIPKGVYADFKARSHKLSTPGDLVRFVDEGLKDEFLLDLTAQLRKIARDKGYDELAELHLVMAFTLCLAYVYDDGGEYPKYPAESLVDRGGDCEDHAILCGAILHNCGHKACLVVMDTGAGSGHAALGVVAPEQIEGISFYVREMGTEVFYCEVTPGTETTQHTTAVQWWLGMAPPSDASNFRFYPICAA